MLADADLLDGWVEFATLRATGHESDAKDCALDLAERLRMEGLPPDHPARLTFEVLAASSSSSEQLRLPSGLPPEVASLWNWPEQPPRLSGSVGTGQISVDGYPGTGKSTLLYGHAQAVALVPELAVLRRVGTPLDGATVEESIQISKAILKQEVSRTAYEGAQVLDRSWLSHLSYAFAYEAQTNQMGLYEAVAQHAADLVTQAKLKVPDASFLLQRQGGSSRTPPSGFQALPRFYSEEIFREAWQRWWWTFLEANSFVQPLKLGGGIAESADQLIAALRRVPSHEQNWDLELP